MLIRARTNDGQSYVLINPDHIVRVLIPNDNGPVEVEHDNRKTTCMSVVDWVNFIKMMKGEKTQ
jgi:hypothetical protein